MKLSNIYLIFIILLLSSSNLVHCEEESRDIEDDDEDFVDTDFGSLG